MKQTPTCELLNILSNIHSKAELNSYIKKHTTTDNAFHFHIAFSKLLYRCGKKKSEVIRDSTLDRTYAYQILNGTKIPSRDKVLALCIATGCSLDDTQHLLENMNEGILYSRSSRDAVIIYGIEHKLSVMDVNELLADSLEKILA